MTDSLTGRTCESDEDHRSRRSRSRACSIGRAGARPTSCSAILNACCAHRPAGHSTQQRRLLRRSRHRRRSAQARRHPCGRHRQQCAFRHRGHHSPRSRDSTGSASLIPAPARTSPPRARRSSSSAAACASAFCSARRFTGRPITRRARNRPASPSSRATPPITCRSAGCAPACRHSTGRACRPRSSPGPIATISHAFKERHRGAAAQGRRAGRVVPLGTRRGGARLHDRDRARRDRRRRRHRRTATGRTTCCRSRSTRASRSSTA